MKPWNTWVARLGCAGLCLTLAGCGGSSVPDPESDANAAKGAVPSAAPAAPAIAESSPEPAPAPVPAPAPAPTPEPTAAPAPAPTAAEPPPAQPKPEEAAASKPAGTPAPAAPAPGSPAPSASADGKADNNPFAVLSESQSPPPAAASAAPPAAEAPAAEAVAEVPPQEVPPADAAPAAEGPQDALGFLQAAAANRGVRKNFTSPTTAATVFLAAIKEKDLNKVAQATALRAATESKNQKLFQLILSQELAQEDLDELAKKLAGYKVTGSNVPKSTGIVGITITKSQGKSTLRRNLNMRHEKAGWKVQDIGGEGEMQMQIMMPRMGGRGGGRR